MDALHKEIGVILGMAERGDNHHDIAAWFGTHLVRRGEILQAENNNFPLAASQDLLPKGSPGPKSLELRSRVKEAQQMLVIGHTDAALVHLIEALKAFNSDFD